MSRMTHHCTKTLRLAVFTAAMVVAGGVLATSPVAGAGQNFPTAPPAPGPAPKLTVPTPFAQTLPNAWLFSAIPWAASCLHLMLSCVCEV